MKRGWMGILFAFVLVLGMVLTLSFVNATYIAKSVTDNTLGTIFYVNEDVGFIYNISINNTNAAALTNITEVNITLPSQFSFLADSNSTDKGAVNNSFINTTYVLSWNYTTGLLLNSTWDYFQFNASTLTPGTYQFVVLMSNLTGTNSTNITVVVNDTTAANISLSSPAHNTNGTTSAYNFTFTVIDEGNDSVNCSLIVDNAVIHYLTDVNHTGKTLGMYNSSFGYSTYTWSVNCTDGNRNVGNSSTRTFIVSRASSSTDSSSGGGGGVVVAPEFWTKTYTETNVEFSEKVVVEKTMAQKEKTSIKIDGTTHSVGVIKIESSSRATINVSSRPQQKEIYVNTTEKFEVTDDNFYDVAVRLNEIVFGKANITMTYIHEEIPSAQPANIPVEENLTVGGVETEEGGENSWWLWVVLGILVLGVVGFLLYMKMRQNK